MRQISALVLAASLFAAPSALAAFSVEGGGQGASTCCAKKGDDKKCDPAACKDNKKCTPEEKAKCSGDKGAKSEAPAAPKS